MPIAKGTAPLFEQYSMEELERLTPYRFSYLAALKQGSLPITGRFRDVVAKCLRRSEAELFGTEN